MFNITNRVLTDRLLNHKLIIQLTVSEYQLAEWLIDDMNPANNIVMTKLSDVARRAHRSSRVVNTAVAKLGALKLLKGENGTLMISPQLAFYGSSHSNVEKYKKLIDLYRNF